MKREIKIIGVQPYNTNFNGNTYVGTRYYYVFKHDGCDGNACSYFKIPYDRMSNYPSVKLGDEFTAYIERTQNGERLDDLVPLV